MMDKQRPLSYPELEKERELSLVLKSYETLLADALTEYSAVEDIPEEGHALECADCDEIAIFASIARA